MVAAVGSVRVETDPAHERFWGARVPLATLAAEVEAHQTGYDGIKRTRFKLESTKLVLPVHIEEGWVCRIHGGLMGVWRP